MRQPTRGVAGRVPEEPGRHCATSCVAQPANNCVRAMRGAARGLTRPAARDRLTVHHLRSPAFVTFAQFAFTSAFVFFARRQLQPHASLAGPAHPPHTHAALLAR